MFISRELLQPVIALSFWTMVVWFWMYWTRIPAIVKMKMKLDAYAPRGEQMSTLPAEVRWKADNYNHLMEQPTVFYAVAISMAFLNINDQLSLILAWCYVSLRVVHSLVQAIYNNVMHRFIVFFISSIVLFALVLRAIFFFL